MKNLYAIIAFCLLISYTPFSQSISSNAPLCGNANLTLELTATGGTTYAWKGPNNFTSTQQKPSIKNVNYRNRGVYTVTVDNKTTLTTDVNVKDPMAFTVPKEISVCEGGTLIIEPKSARLTDSTEVAEEFSIQNSYGTYTGSQVKNFSNKDIGIYKITGDVGSFSSNKDKSCPSSQNINVIIKKVTDCKSIEVGDLSKVKMCYGQDISIPFTTKGNFKQGTKFKVYVLRANETFSQNLQPDATTEKSLITLKITKYFDSLIKIRIVADDAEQTTIISEPYFYSYANYVVYNHNNLAISVNPIFCDSIKLSSLIGVGGKADFLQWTLDGKDIKDAVFSTLTVNKNGNYSFKFKEVYANEINKTCLYESQPVKIELGKIEKPSVSVNNDIELCVGKPATLNVSSKANTNYRWKKDGNYIANATNTSYQTSQEGKYQIEAKEGTCTAVSDTVVLKKPEKLDVSFYTLQDVPLEYISGGVKLCNNQIYAFKGGVIYSNKFIETNLQWFKDNSVVKDSVRNELRNLKGEGTYTLKAEYGQCSGISSNYAIKYSKNLNAQTYNSSEFCEFTGGTINLNSARLFSSNTKADYILSKGTIYYEGNPINDWLAIGNDRYSSNIQVTKPGKYYAVGKLIFKDGRECLINTDTTNVTVVKKLQDIPYGFDNVLKAVPLTTCKDTIFINSKNNNSAYSYLGKEINYKWTKDGISLKQDSSSTLQATQAGLYQLETIYKGLSCPILSSPYKIVLGEIKVDFFQWQLPNICDGQTFSFYPKLSEYSDKNIYQLFKDGQFFSDYNKLLQSGAYYGYLNLTQSGTYKLKVTNGKCEGTSPDFTLKVDKIPTTITPSDSVTFCVGKTVELKTSTEAGLSYIWERNGLVISQANQANYTATTDGLYKAILLRGACWGTTPSVKLKTLANIIPTATLTGDKKIDYDTETKLSINLTSHAPWTFKLSDGKEYTATKSPFEVSVKPLSTTTYSVTEVKNICGTGTVSGTTKIEIIILSAEEEKELSVEVFPVPSSEICHWKIETPQATNASVLIYDVLGVTQYSQASTTRTQTHEGTIDLTNMKAGTYFLKFQVGEKSVVRKVMKY